MLKVEYGDETPVGAQSCLAMPYHIVMWLYRLAWTFASSYSTSSDMQVDNVRLINSHVVDAWDGAGEDQIPDYLYSRPASRDLALEWHFRF